MTTPDHYISAQVWRIKAKKRTASQWMMRLVRIKDKQLRAKVAAIVWFDYAADVPKSRPIFTMSLDLRREPFADKLKDALMMVGYPEGVAKRRSVSPASAYVYPGRVY